MKTSRLRTLAAILVALSSVLLTAELVRATAPGAVSWWYRFNSRTTTGFPAPDPPQGVPQGGLFVGRDAHPEHSLAIAGLTFDAASGTSARLELQVAESYREQAASAAIAACPTTGTFGNARAELWENRPQPQCTDLGGTSHKVLGEVQGDGSIITWDLGDGFEVFGGFWSVLLIPDCRGADGDLLTQDEGIGCEAEGAPQTQPPFQVAFEAPDQGTLSVTGQDPAANQPPPPDDVEPLNPGGGGGDPSGGATGGGAGGGSTAGSGGTSGSTGSTGGSGGLTDDSGTSGVGDGTSTTTGDPTVGEASAPTGDSADDSLARTVGIALLAVLGAGLWLASGFMARPRRIASFAGGGTTEDLEEDEQVGGLGRFMRRRSVGPRRLR